MNQDERIAKLELKVEWLKLELEALIKRQERFERGLVGLSDIIQEEEGG